MARVIHTGTTVQMSLATLTDDDSLIGPQSFEFVLHRLTDASFETLKYLMRQRMAIMTAELNPPALTLEVAAPEGEASPAVEAGEADAGPEA